MNEYLYNKAYEKFTPDWFENLTQVDHYLYENNRSLREFWDQYTQQFFQSNNRPFRVLDLGCGLGGMSLYIASQGHEVTGIDISELAIQNANYLAQVKNLSNKVRFLKHDITKLETLKGDFDIIIDSHLLHCIVEDSQRKKYFKFVKRHLRSDSHYMLETMAFQKSFRTPIEYSFDENYNLYREAQTEQMAYRKIKPAFDLEEEVKAQDFNINYFYFHAELTFQLYPEEPDFPIQHLPQTVRVGAKLNTESNAIG